MSVKLMFGMRRREILPMTNASTELPRMPAITALASMALTNDAVDGSMEITVIEPSMPSSDLASFLTSGIFNVIRYWILNDADKSPEEITDIIFAMAAKFVSG